MEETKVIYHIDDETTPYLVKIPLPSAQVTLKDFKMVLNKQNSNFKYFFKSMDADFGVVKEEIVDDATILPCFNGRVVSWVSIWSFYNPSPAPLSISSAGNPSGRVFCTQSLKVTAIVILRSDLPVSHGFHILRP